jgi:hypothetical protein
MFILWILPISMFSNSSYLIFSSLAIFRWLFSQICFIFATNT